MSYVTYYVLLYFICAWQLAFGFLAYNKKTDYGRRLSGFLISSTLVLLTASGFMLTQKEVVAYVFRDLNFIATDIMLIALIRFLNVFSEDVEERKSVLIGFYIYTVIDFISMTINVVVHHAMVLRVTDNGEGGIFYIINSKGIMYYYHVTAFYIMVILAFIVLLMKSVTASKLNKPKYMMILAIYLLANLVNLLLLKKQLVVNYSLLIYGLLSIAMYFTAFIYIPKNLELHVLYMINKDMEQGLIVFDTKGRVSFVNDQMKRLYKIRRNTKKLETFHEQWQKQNGYPEKRVWTESIQTEQELLRYEVSYMKLYDEEKKWIGGCYRAIDRTMEVKEYEKNLFLARFDSLTGVYNRQYFQEVVARVLKDNPEEEYYLVVSDIKDFKLLNDLFGESRGDEVLKRLAELLIENADPGSVYGRIAADQFSALVRKKAFSETKFLDNVYKMNNQYTSAAYRLQIYVGIYEIQDRSESVGVMCDKAIYALQELKGEYGRVLAYYDDSFLNKTLAQNKWISEFDEALCADQFQMFLQPQCDKTGKAYGAEALVRWIHPKEGVISPADFIPAFEKSGLIKRLDIFMWTTAVKRIRAWMDQGIIDRYISVNISTRDFFFVDIYKTLTSLVEYYKIDVKLLKLEITESALMMDVTNAIPIIDRLRRYGFEIELDDFGSGFSSLNMLKDIQADVLKLDMAFIRETVNRERSRAIVAAIIGLSEKLGMPVVAEGVETEEQLELLASMGCDFFQGYYFSKPLSVEEFEMKYFGKSIDVI